MDKPHRQSMDITTSHRRVSGRTTIKLSRRQWALITAGVVVVVGLIGGIIWHVHRNDQTISRDRYQVVYLVTGQIYFGKLQNTGGAYLTLKNVYTVQSQTGSATQTDASSQSKILKVSQQVYGPDDSMAIRAEQVQFWQNLRSDSKVAQAINSSPQP